MHPLCLRSVYRLSQSDYDNDSNESPTDNSFFFVIFDTAVNDLSSQCVRCSIIQLITIIWTRLQQVENTEKWHQTNSQPFIIFFLSQTVQRRTWVQLDLIFNLFFNIFRLVRLLTDSATRVEFEMDLSWAPLVGLCGGSFHISFTYYDFLYRVENAIQSVINDKDEQCGYLLDCSTVVRHNADYVGHCIVVQSTASAQ